MYTVHCDSSLLYDPRLPEYVLFEPLLTLRNNEPGQLSFAVPDGHPCAAAITRLKSRVKVYRDGTLVFLGRIIEDNIGLKCRKSYIAEGILACLIDSIHRPFSFDGTIAELLAQLIAGHNAQVNAEQRFILGGVTVNDDIITVVSTEYLSTWAVLKEYLLDI